MRHCKKHGWVLSPYQPCSECIIELVQATRMLLKLLNGPGVKVGTEDSATFNRLQEALPKCDIAVAQFKEIPDA